MHKWPENKSVGQFRGGNKIHDFSHVDPLIDSQSHVDHFMILAINYDVIKLRNL